jgi:protein ImuB
VLERLLHQLSQGLIEQGQGVLQLECRLVCRNHQPLIVNVGLFQPTVSPQHLLGLIEMQLERLISPEAVEEVHVIAASTAPREQRQNDLFAGGSRDDPSKLALLVERLSSRLGRDRVASAQLQAEPQVELAYRCVPLTGGPTREFGGRSFVAPPSGGFQRRPALCNRPKAVPQTGSCAGSEESSQPTLGPMLRPLRIFDPPEPVDVVGIALDGPPAMFRYRHKQYRVARHFGPERIETGWWRGPSSRRDYYRVETEAGNRMWLFRRLQDKKWFLHGEFV